MEQPIPGQWSWGKARRHRAGGRPMHRGAQVRFLRLSVVFACLLPADLPAADDAYLNALKAEAVRSGTGGTAATGRGGPQAFEAWLSSEYAGSYAFYSRLNENERAAVYRAYRDGADIDALRARIRELLKD